MFSGITVKHSNPSLSIQSLHQDISEENKFHLEEIPPPTLHALHMHVYTTHIYYTYLHTAGLHYTYLIYLGNTYKTIVVVVMHVRLVEEETGSVHGKMSTLLQVQCCSGTTWYSAVGTHMNWNWQAALDIEMKYLHYVPPFSPNIPNQH